MKELCVESTVAWTEFIVHLLQTFCLNVVNGLRDLVSNAQRGGSNTKFGIPLRTLQNSHEQTKTCINVTQYAKSPHEHDENDMTFR